MKLILTSKINQLIKFVQMKKLLTIIILFLVWGNISFAGVEEVLKEIKKNKDLSLIHI